MNGKNRWVNSQLQKNWVQIMAIKKEPFNDNMKPSHHELPKKPGSDMDHDREDARAKDRQRSWQEHHKENNPKKR